jgi:hypothetical protein
VCAYVCVCVCVCVCVWERERETERERERERERKRRDPSFMRKVRIHNALLLRNGVCQPWCVTIVKYPNTWKSFSVICHNFRKRKSCIYFPYLLDEVHTWEKVLLHCIYAQSEYLSSLPYFLFNPRGLVRGKGHLSESKVLFFYLLL